MKPLRPTCSTPTFTAQEASALSQAAVRRCTDILRKPWMRPKAAPGDRIVETEVVLLAMLTELEVRGAKFEKLYGQYSSDERLAAPVIFGRLKRGEDVRLLDDVPSQGPSYGNQIRQRVFDTAWILDKIRASTPVCDSPGTT